MSEKENISKSIIISRINKIGIVHLHGIEKYLKRSDIEKSYFITPNIPHENVLNHAKKISSLEIIISADFSKEKEKIEDLYPEAKIILIDPYHLAGRDGMLDA